MPRDQISLPSPAQRALERAMGGLSVHVRDYAERMVYADRLFGGVISATEYPPEMFSGATLIELAEREIRAIDEQIFRLVHAMRDTRNRIAKLNSIGQRLRDLTVERAPRDRNDPRWASSPHDQNRVREDSIYIDLNTERIEIQDADGQVRNVTIAEACRELGVDLNPYTRNGRILINGSNIEALQRALQTAADNMNQNTEINQLRLQELVSTRSQRIQMISQMMASGHQTQKSITENMRG